MSSRSTARPANLLDELQNALAHGTVARRVETLRRVVATSEPRLIREDGSPTFGLNFYAVNKKGEFGAASMRPNRFRVCDSEGERRVDTAYLFER